MCDAMVVLYCIYAVYGWLNTFPIEVYKGDTVELEIGIFKGQFDSVRQVRVDFNSTGKIGECGRIVLLAELHNNFCTPNKCVKQVN